MPNVVLPHTFVDGPGNAASGEEVMDNLNAIVDVVNGALDSDNIDNTAQIEVHDLKVTAPTDGLNSDGDLYYRAEGGDHYFISTVGGWGTCHAAAYTVESDERGKSAIKPLKGALEKLGALRGVSFKRKGSQGRQVGLVAQEVSAALPEAVVLKVRKADPKNTEPTLGVDVMGVVGLLVAAVNELAAKVEALEG